ncbi:MAG: hypothetical protein OEN55_11830 [Alphaproteobacteria bacterium]|nr:hypothetical protein [Alphaproteobacteria bacterium]
MTENEAAALAIARKSNDASLGLNTPVNKTLRDVLWDIELRLRGLNAVSADAGIAAADTRAAYTQELKKAVEGYS